MLEEQPNRTPLFYVRQRLFNNKVAVSGLVIIAIAHFIAISGYLLLPDKTPNANDSAPQIRKKLPFFSVTMLKMRQDREVEETSLLERFYVGRPEGYTIQPIVGEPEIFGDSVFFIPYPGVEKDKQGNIKQLGEHLLRIVKPIFVGDSEKLGKKAFANFRSIDEGDGFEYLDLGEQKVSITKEQLEQEFWDNCVEERTYFLGTDTAGRDMLSRLLFGTRISLAIGFMAVLISLFVGVTFGALAGFFGGRVDAVVNWLMTVIWSIPSIMLVIVISLVLGKGLGVVFLAVGLTMWVDIARVVRGEIMAIKEKQFVEAARAYGFSDRRIIFKHILPNIVGPLIVISTSNFATAILVEAGLSFLGFGVEIPTPSWGTMINEGFHFIATRNSWHLILFPSIAISTTVFAFNVFGNGLRDAYDPKSLNN